jgi:hypothetical protein
MLLTGSVILGLVLGGVLLLFARRADAVGGPGLPKPPWPRWAALLFGAIGAGSLAVAMPGGVDSSLLMASSIGFPVAGVVLAVGLLAGGDRRWPVWAGLVLALAPTLFWAWFALAEILGPAH